MRALIQWARSNPLGWEEMDSADWAMLPDKRASANRSVNADAGWVNALNVQGMVFEGYDRVAIVDNGDGSIDVWCVNDDAAAGWDAATRYMRHVQIRPLRVDDSLGGAINTDMNQTIYSDDPVFAPSENTVVRPWGAASGVPADSLFRHGVMLANGLYAAHTAAQELRSWREWTDGVDPGLIGVDGRVVQQRRSGRYLVPDGTKTFYMNNVALATGVHAGDFELELGSVPAGAVQIESGNIGSNGSIVAVGTTLGAEPNNAAWPTGTYRCQIDVLAVNTDVTFGLLTQGTATGHFARVDSALVSDLETKQQAESAFSFTGIKLATSGSVSWAGGSVNDRFEVAIAAVRASGHGNATMTIEIGESDDFVDGPWPSGVSAENPPMFGANF